jgi:diguanylate cyclase (GGDEF)-like protein
VPLARSPDSFGDGEFDALAASPASALEYLSPSSGVYRVGSYNHLARYTMSAMVAEDSAVILSEWRGQLRVHGVIVLCILLVIGVLGYRVDRANRATRVQALCDGLTELPNRRCFDLTIEREFQRTARNGRPLSLIMVDIDLFKSFNDRYGHPAGDTCLRAISAAVQGVLCRPGDMAARYGGEEIAILLPETDVAGAARIAADMLAAVRAQAIRHEASPFGIVTLSAGVASWSPEQRTATWQWLVEVADAALYTAKALGRNTFTLHPTAEAIMAASSMAREKAA